MIGDLISMQKGFIAIELSPFMESISEMYEEGNKNREITFYLKIIHLFMARMEQDDCKNVVNNRQFMNIVDSALDKGVIILFYATHFTFKQIINFHFIIFVLFYSFTE